MQKDFHRTGYFYIGKFLKFIANHKYFIAVILIPGIYSYILSMRTMPFAEGWYTYYAQCINRGEIAYRDFDYLFPPLYIYLVSFITNIFGYKIIVLRLIGIVFFCLISGIVFLIFRELFEESHACIATITAVFFLQSEVVQIFYDYIRFMDIFACATLLLLVKAVKSLNGRNYYLYLFFSGISNALFYLVKQNMGLLFAVYAVILICAVNFVQRKRGREIVKSVALYLEGILTPILLVCAIMLFTGSYSSYIRLTGADAIAAKGGVTAILFGWLRNNIISFRNGSFFSIIILIMLLLVFSLKWIFHKIDWNLVQGGVEALTVSVRSFSV